MIRGPKQTPRDDLDWLFGQCESECGIRSAFGSMISALSYSRPPGRPQKAKGQPRKDGRPPASVAQEQLFNEDTMIESLDARSFVSRLGAAARNRRVMGAYSQLPARAKVALEAALEPRQRPPQVRDLFGDDAGVVHLTPTALELGERFSLNWLAAAIARKDPLVQKIRKEAHDLLEGSIAAFALLRGAR